MNLLILYLTFFTVSYIAADAALKPVSFHFMLSKDGNFRYKKDNIGVLHHRKMSSSVLPRSFDAKDKWPECKDIIGKIRHQGNCASCWGVVAASVFSDRICIGTGGKVSFHLSAYDIMSCCPDCAPGNPCVGGYSYKVWRFLHLFGSVTGGELNSGEGCKPYPAEVFHNGSVAPCRSSCLNPNYTKPYHKDKYSLATVYLLPNDEEQIREEIFDNGPVMASMTVYDDFVGYKKGVYERKSSIERGGHGVKIRGWGEEDGKKYWLGQNSFGEEWGDSGLFKFLRGTNHCAIEDEVRAGKITRLNSREFLIDNPYFTASARGKDEDLWIKGVFFLFIYYIIVTCIV